ncbi:DUF418 domain-containing protein [Amycolatopsis carbonis]|uniref:DUF418 domain-containing protein n=1 Tax=Amycolatopsis carbonis TaxID=715471 RepID=A0A9Y2IQM0_9PSEU|nr:DUF418 domain-containing protein [Amycolatopsis sp. 2-15]WIX83626.1 DUF418 domain-containing protein [Amycolatopsis sp. 2-15]
MNTTSPTQGLATPVIRQRIESIDIIRAISVMAILLVNIGAYYTKTSPGHHPAPVTSAVDTWSGRLVDLLVLDKFHLIFAFLFGVSAAIQFGNMSRRGKFWAPYLRRMAILLVFGLANAFLLHAPDVLTLYAINGALLALLFRAPQGVLLTIGLVVGLGGDLGTTTVALTDHYAGTGMGQMSWLASAVAVQSFGHTVLGCWALRAGLLTDERRLPVVRALFAATAVGTVALWAWTLSLTDGNLAHVLEANLAIVPAVAYLSGLVLLLRSARLRAALLPLQRYGRMALTSYLTHAILGLVVVGALASAWTIPSSVLLLLCVPIWLIQLVFSHVWLSRFAYGPFEWLWRAGTYLSRPAPKPRN